MQHRTCLAIVRVAAVLLVVAVGAAIAIFGKPVPSLAASSVVAAALAALVTARGQTSAPAEPDATQRLAERLIRNQTDSDEGSS